MSINAYLSLEENMMFQSCLYRIPKARAKQRMEKLICDFGLQGYRKYPVASYSGGIKRRLDIALNMMSDPRILFLDEPTVRMDIQSCMAMWDMMRKIRDDFDIIVLEEEKENILIVMKTRACLKIAFCKMCVPICGGFVPKTGGVVGYADCFRGKFPAKWGVQIAGMNFQTRSSSDRRDSPQTAAE